MPRAPLIAVLVAISAFQVVAAGDESYRVDPANSRVTIHVDKSGAFSFLAGHRHEVVGPFESGSVDVDREMPSRSRVRLIIPTGKLKVSGQGEPPGDVPKVQEAMESDKVLDVMPVPADDFESTAVSVVSGRGDSIDLRVAGQLTVRDVQQPVTADVHVIFTGSGLTAAGRFPLKQSAFGIKPISVAGAVSVKDTLEIDFSISATKAAAK